jgi:hypothetical protein
MNEATLCQSPIHFFPGLRYGAIVLLFQAEDSAMTPTNVKDEAHRLIEQLPDDATWEDLQYQIYFRQAVEAGLKDANEGRKVSLDEARRRFGLNTP